METIAAALMLAHPSLLFEYVFYCLFLVICHTLVTALCMPHVQLSVPPAAGPPAQRCLEHACVWLTWLKILCLGSLLFCSSDVAVPITALCRRKDSLSLPLTVRWIQTMLVSILVRRCKWRILSTHYRSCMVRLHLWLIVMTNETNQDMHRRHSRRRL